MLKKIFSAVLLTLCFVNGVNSQPYTPVSSVIMNQYANDMVYNPSMSRILISIPSADVIHGNSVGMVNPVTAQLTNSYFVGSEPNPIALTDNNAYLYIGLDGSGNIKKFDLASNTVSQSINLGADGFLGPRFANSISCQPGNDSVIAVARRFNGVSPMCAGTAIYSNGLKLNDTISQYTKTINVVHFYSPSVLYSYNYETTGYDFSTISVTTNGASLVSSVGSLIYGFFVEFYIQGNMAVSDNGIALDLTSAPTLLGTFNLSTAWGYGTKKACFDPYLNLVCFAQKGFWTDTVYVQRFHANNLLLNDVIAIGNITDDVNKFINCGGPGCMAFSTVDGKLVIINGFASSVQATASAPDFSVFPNPSDGIFNIKINNRPTQNIAIDVSDASGKLIYSENSNADFFQVDLANEKNGYYFLKFKNETESRTMKVLKSK